jgi:hypothetical protein
MGNREGAGNSMSWTRWSEVETELARKYYYLLGPDDFKREVGRSKEAAKRHLQYVNDPNVRKRHQLKMVELRAAQKRGELIAASKEPSGPPPKILWEALERATKPRSLTAWICGDPAPGWSALERRT